VTPESQPRLFSVGTATASAAVVVASLSDVFLHPTPHSGPLLACAATYLVAAIAGSFVVDRRRRGRGLLVAALLVLGCAAVWISRAKTILILMPLVSLVAVRYSRPMTAALLVFLGAWVAVAIGQSHGGPGPGMTAVGNFLAAALFTVIFSRLVVQERQASAALATAQERNRIAREIHDGLGHYLTSANMQLEAARAVIADGAAAPRVSRAQDLLREGLGEVRRSVAMLRTSGNNRPFTAALGALIDDARASGLAAALHIGGTVRPLGPAIEFALYRVAQEALTNVMRHAGAARAELRVSYDEGSVDLSVEDDGVGAPENPGPGFGLVGLRERVELLGGAVDVGRAPAGGLSLRVRVPA
jgi:signal transduction histidine kinase